MTRVMLAVLLAAGHLGMATKPVSAGSPEEVQALVERAAEYIRVHGRQQAFADFNRPDGGFVDGDLYVFCDDAAGVNLANGGNPNSGRQKPRRGARRQRQAAGLGFVPYHADERAGDGTIFFGPIRPPAASSVRSCLPSGSMTRRFAPAATTSRIGRNRRDAPAIAKHDV